MLQFQAAILHQHCLHAAGERPAPHTCTVMDAALDDDNSAEQAEHLCVTLLGNFLI